MLFPAAGKKFIFKLKTGHDKTTDCYTFFSGGPDGLHQRGPLGLRGDLCGDLRGVGGHERARHAGGAAGREGRRGDDRHVGVGHRPGVRPAPARPVARLLHAGGPTGQLGEATGLGRAA